MSEEAAPHVLLICFPGQGHVNPTLRLAKRIAAKGLLVTCCTTSGVGAQLAASSGVSAGGDGVRVGRGRVRFEFLDDHGKEKFDLLRYLKTSAPLAFAELLGRQAGAGRPVVCVVGNPFLPWAVDVAADAGVPSAVLWVQSCAVFSLYYHYAHGLVEFPPEDDLDARVALPGLPALSVAEVPSFLLPSNPYKDLADAILDQCRNIDKASWVFVNSFSELERDVVAALPSVMPRPPGLIPVGPLIELEDGAVVRGDLIKAADDCVGWLDTRAPRSVVYASVGSVVVLSAEEVAEMAHGLASTGRPFMWVVRPDTRPLLPAGFSEAIADRGMVVPWSPQDRVLPHALRVELHARDGGCRRARGDLPSVGRPVHGRQVPGRRVQDGRPPGSAAEAGGRARGRGRRRGWARGRRHALQRQVVERGGAGGRGARRVVGPARSGVRGRGFAASTWRASNGG